MYSLDRLDDILDHGYTSWCINPCGPCDLYLEEKQRNPSLEEIPPDNSNNPNSPFHFLINYETGEMKIIELIGEST